MMTGCTRFLALLLSLAMLAPGVLAHTDDTEISRSQLIHPDLGHEGGAALLTKIRALYTRLGDDSPGRYEEYTAVANSTTNAFVHNFGVALSELRVLVYTGSGTNLTRVLSPVASGWTIAATSGSEKTSIDVTTPGSGGPHTYALVVLNVGALYLSDLTDIDFSTPATANQSLVYDGGSSKWEPGLASFPTAGTAKFYETDNTNFIGLKAPGTVTADRTFIFPDGDGTTGQVLGTNGSQQLGWYSVVTDPMTTRGDIIVRNSSNVTARQAVGAANTVFASDGTDPSWRTIMDADINASAAISGSKLVAASASVPGAVTTSAQSFAGVKTFNSGVQVSSGGSTLSTYSAWADWTTTISKFTGSGTLTSPTSATGRWSRVGNIVSIELRVPALTIATGGITLNVTLPVAAKTEMYHPIWAESNSVSEIGIAVTVTASTNCRVFALPAAGQFVTTGSNSAYLAFSYEAN